MILGFYVCFMYASDALSEEITHPTVYYHQLSVDNPCTLYEKSAHSIEHQQKCDWDDDIQWSELFFLRVYL